MSDAAPETWTEKSLGELCEVTIGGTPSRAEPRYWSNEDGGFPWVSIADLRSGRVERTKEFISEAGIQNSNVKLVPRGTVLMSFKLTIGRTAVAGRDLYTNEAIAAFQPRSDVDRKFLFYWLPYLASTAETDQAVKGATLNKQKLLALAGKLPPLDEQRRIAEVLRSVDKAIAASDKVSKHQNALKTHLAVIAFSHGLRGAGTRETVIGPIPAHWGLSRLEEITHSVGVGIASSATHAYVADGTPLLRNQNIKAGHLDLSDLLYVSDEYDASFASKRVKTGDVITMRTGYPGASAVIPDELNGCQTFTTLISRPDQRVIQPRFLCEWINSPTGMREVSKRQAGGAQQNLNAGALKLLPVPVPPLEEQAEIAALLDSFPAYDDGSTTLLAVRDNLRIDLLSGRVRVPA